MVCSMYWYSYSITKILYDAAAPLDYTVDWNDSQKTCKNVEFDF